MNERDKILTNIKKALEKPSDKKIPKPDFQAPLYAPLQSEDLAVLFAENLHQIQGNFCFCDDERDFLVNLTGLIRQKNTKNVYAWEKPLQELLDHTNISYQKDETDFLKADIGITLCEMLIARDGGVLVSSKQLAGRRLTIFPHVHVVLAYTSQIVYDIEAALSLMRERYRVFPSMVSFTHGPSRTADIEKTLVLGAHGPKELHVFLIDDQI